MTSLSSIKDVDKKILQSLEDKDLFEVLLTKNKYLYYLTDDLFWKIRLLNKYPYAVQYKPENQKWKQYYLNVVYYIDKLIIEKGYIYTHGDPKFIYDFLFKTVYTKSANENIRYALDKGYEDLALYYTNIIRNTVGIAPVSLGTSAWEAIKRAILN